MSSAGYKCGSSVTMVKKTYPHTTVVLGGLVNHGTVMGTDVKKNFISDGCKGKKSKNDVVWVQNVHIALTKSASLAGLNVEVVLL